MVGTWEIRDAAIVETNSGSPSAPLNGTQIVIDPQGVVSVGGLSVARTDLETLLTFPLTLYVNQVNGRTVLYGIGYDRLAAGGVRERVGVAGGAIDDNTISIEAFNGIQSQPQDPEIYTRSRYTLVRVSTAILIPAKLGKITRDLAPEAARSARVALHAMFGKN
jgi:hypothetical protein